MQVATNAGTHCGPHGTSICSALAVTVRAFARRDISVSFQLNVNSASAIRLARSTLSTYLVSSQFVTDLNNEGGGQCTRLGQTLLKDYWQGWQA